MPCRGFLRLGLAQLRAEKQTSEAARFETARIAVELEMRNAAMAAMEFTVKELKQLYEAERHARTVAEKEYAILATKLERQGLAVTPVIQVLPE